ncbi:hypothetical protein JCGZ_02741 [Jatropha curcas]|uniref:Uncharacterized protein n=1 Tax=Jatropha curcas TaxID=180498 RepID=A0A067KU62_JATCU|nr:hypothetical protein JCGZ_02741 [Jatropha curcas]
MARGRAFDSDASGNGPHGGRGRGRTTRGRGGNIPPSSSSGMSGASFSAQPPVSPSLPSVPSSFTPLPRPIESSPASQSPTAQEAFCMGRGHYDYAKSGLGEIVRSKDAKKRQEAAMRVSGDMRELAEGLEDLTFKRKCDIFARNRRSETGGDGAGPFQHTSGSISAIETSQLLAKKYGSEPTPMEVFTYIHTKDHDGNTFVDRCALGINAHVDEQERQHAELRAHVMRMFGQHGAGASSSHPPPAIDRDVSTALRQPSSSHLDPDTANDTLVTPADTTTHPTDTPANATTLDRVEDRPRRFDFGPFYLFMIFSYFV